MQGNLNPSARVAIAGVIAPAQAAAGTYTTGWLDMRTFWSVLAIINTGVLGAGGTIDAKVEQATSAAGAGAKNVVGSAITQIVKATGDNKQVEINLVPADLDKNGGYKFARLSLTVGTAASFVSALLVGVDARYGAASANQASTVTETVG